MQIVALDDTNQPDALAYLRRAPYRNAVLLSNVTQLRQQCDVLVGLGDHHVLGVATHYRSLPFVNLSFAVEYAELLPPFLAAMAEAVPRLRTASVTGIMPEARAIQLAPYVDVESLSYEWQMVVEPETLRDHPSEAVRRLQVEDLPAMNALADLARLTAWQPGTFANGPAFGAFVDGQLVSMAATHFATTEVIEIGHVATHPNYRRRGFAAACTSALTRACFGLVPRVYLMVLIDNEPAFAAYRTLGFQPMERFGLISFRLREEA